MEKVIEDVPITIIAVTEISKNWRRWQVDGWPVTRELPVDFGKKSVYIFYTHTREVKSNDTN